MTARIIMGNRGGSYGLWVSAPGYDVLGAGPDQMLLSTDQQLFQVIAQGTIYNPANGGVYDLGIPVLDYTPLVLAGGAWETAYQIVSTGVLRLWTFSNGAFEDSAGASVSWAVTNQRIWH